MQQVQLREMDPGVCEEYDVSTYYSPRSAHSIHPGTVCSSKKKEKNCHNALDQSQEHSVKYLKDGGGTKGLQQDEKEVIEITKPEVLRYLDEF